MNLLLILALFAVTVVILIRVPERGLSLLLAALTLMIGAMLMVVNLKLGSGGTGKSALTHLNRAEGFLTVGAAVLGSAWLLLGSEGKSLPSLGLGRLRQPTRPVRVQRTAPPGKTQGHLTGNTGLGHTGPGNARRSSKSTQGGSQTSRPAASRASGSTLIELDFQDYEVLDKVGVGGMGSVYRARRKADNKTVALKVPQERYLADAKFIKRFYREAELLQKFNHPNVVKVYDYRMQDPEHYIAMEFLDGSSLEHLLEERPLTFEQSVQVLRALADALRHIHSHNVVHRDIKPANIMVVRGAFDEHGVLHQGGVKLMDFGIAVGKVLTRLTSTGARVGTPIYMAPEQAKGNRVDGRSDVYSLGLVAYEMISGQTAFKGSYEAVVHQQVFETPKSPKQVRLEVPGKLNDLILHMIEKDPAARPTLDEIIARLDAGVLSDEVFSDPVALAVSLQEKRGMLRLLDLEGKLRVSLRDLSHNDNGLPGLPAALASDAQGNLYLSLAEYREGRNGALIRKLNPAGKEVLAFGTYGMGEGELLQPLSMAATQERLYVLDGETRMVNVFTPDGRFVRRFGGPGGGQGTFDRPTTIVANQRDEVFVLDSGNREIQRFSPSGDYLSRYAFRLDRQSETLRPLDGLGLDPQGNVYLVDTVGKKVRRIDPEGKPGLTFAIETLVGEPTDTPWLLQIAEDGKIYAIRKGAQVLRTYSSVGDLLSSQDLYAPVQAINLLHRPRQS